MRVTNSTVLRNYDRNLKRLGKNKFDSERKIYSGRQFSRASENPLSAAKALTIRKQLMHNEQYMENLDVADKFYTEAETSMLQISEELALVRETMIYAANSTKDPEVDLNILAQQLETKAREMCSVFNTNSAERVIFGGESNNPEPFTFSVDENGHASEILYHGVPVNAYQDYAKFPYSNEVYIDMGIGIVTNQETQAVDPQSALKVSFNGADLTGCGADKYEPAIDLTKLEAGKDYSIDLFVEGNTYTVKFKGAADAAGEYDPAATVDNINKAIEDVFDHRYIEAPTVDADGNLANATDTQFYIANTKNAENRAALDNGYEYSANYIQITLDAARALRDGDIEYVNGCIDKIVSSSENLLVEIADLGCSEEYIAFNKGRFETRELNLKDRQDTLEATDLESEITLYKTYEALYNACLQMSSSVIPNSIFNYIR